MSTPVALFRPIGLSGPVGADARETALTALERARRDRLRTPADLAAFTAAHLLVRACAATLIGCPPADVVINQHCTGCGADGHGRPSVQGHPQIWVSLSHTRGCVAAIAASQPCGIDVEVRRTRPPVSGALTAEEARWVERQSDPDAFTRLWVRKEALVKAGVGALDDMVTRTVLDEHGPATRLAGIHFVEWASVGHLGVYALTE